MNITFSPLAFQHFPLLLKWLKAPHVKAWWDPDIKWTPELVQEKYASYVKGYKLENSEAKEMHAYIITVSEKLIGYIQIYNAYDFPRDIPLSDLPESLAAFDVFIGEYECLGKNIGSQAIQKFLESFCDRKYTHIFADPDCGNIAAIRAYEKAGFQKIKSVETCIWMLKENQNA